MLNGEDLALLVASGFLLIENLENQKSAILALPDVAFHKNYQILPISWVFFGIFE